MTKTDLLILAPFVMAVWWGFIERAGNNTRWKDIPGSTVPVLGVTGFICFIVYICIA